MKYIMFERELTEGVTQLIPIIFPDFLVHDEISAIIRRDPQMMNAAPVSAGDIDLGVVLCTGNSETLQMPAQKDDAHVISSYDYLHGVG